MIRYDHGMRGLLLGLVALGMVSSAAAEDAAKPRVIVLEIHRDADGKRYPTPVDEMYRLEADGVLHYSAYFGNMPIEMNHNDSIAWKSGEAGKKVFAAFATVATRLDKVPDDRRGVYVIGYHRGESRAIANKQGKAFKAVDPAFRALIAAFEKATGRPLKAGDLPQTPRTPPKK